MTSHLYHMPDRDEQRSRSLNLIQYDDYLGIGVNKTRSGEGSDLIVRLDPEVFAAMVNDLEGFECSYEKKVTLPEGIGAVIEFANAPVNGLGPSPADFITRFGRNHWIGANGYRYADDFARDALREGGRVRSEGVEL